MSVEARFYVSSVTRNAYNRDASNIELQPVSRGEENKQWAAATPSGQIKLSITNGAASKWFEDRLGLDVAIAFFDRPLPCTHCGKEIRDEPQQPFNEVILHEACRDGFTEKRR